MLSNWLISTSDLAKLLGWETRRARRWLRKTGTSFTVGRSGRYFTTKIMLQHDFPELWALIAERDAAREDQQRPRQRSLQVMGSGISESLVSDSDPHSIGKRT